MLAFRQFLFGFNIFATLWKFIYSSCVKYQTFEVEINVIRTIIHILQLSIFLSVFVAIIWELLNLAYHLDL